MKPACDGAELCVYTDRLNGAEMFLLYSLRRRMVWTRAQTERKETKCNKKRSVYLGCW